jgi:NAD(P)-dependent dehydrogenase (short-subunit alcohol dehydrogenase family)
MITGGARGIGFGIAEAMLAAGYEVIVTGLEEAEVAVVPARAGLTAIRLDVTDERSVADAVAPFDRLDALVNCAGIIARGGAEFDIAVFQKIIDVNLTGTMRMCLAAREKLARAAGAIVNMASILSFFGGPLVPAYSASKGGVMQLTKALAVAWAAQGIRVNAIAPGWIATDMTRALTEDEARAAAIMARTPMGRWGEPIDIGGAAVFLCSPEARFVTGSIVTIDGGYAAA